MMSTPALVALAIQGGKSAAGFGLAKYIIATHLGMAADTVHEWLHPVAAQQREDLARHRDQLTAAGLDG
jgi:hypothetical protein